MKLTRLLFAVLLFATCFSLHAKADDQNSELIVRLFDQVCVAHMGEPEKVKAFATQSKLAEITDPTLLNVFVGSKGNGQAWYVRGLSTQQFALSERETTQTCAMWAEQADPTYVEDAFLKIMKKVERPGVTVTKDKESAHETPFGHGKVLLYKLSDPASNKGTMEFTMITIEKPGGLFQASLQVESVPKHDAPKAP